MAPRTVTALSFLADSLVAEPGRYEELLDMARKQRAEPSAEYRSTIRALDRAFRAASPRTMQDVADLAERLAADRSVTNRRAAHVLRWGLAER